LFDRRDKSLQALDAVEQQPALVGEMLHCIPRRSEDSGDVIKREPEFAVEEDLLQPLEVRVVIDAVARRRSSGRRQQRDVLVVVKRSDRDARPLRNLSDRVAHVLPPMETEQPDATSGSRELFRSDAGGQQH